MNALASSKDNGILQAEESRLAILVVVADRGRARLFLISENSTELVEILDLVNSDARLPENELNSDRQGRGLYGGLHGRHGRRTTYGKSGSKHYQSTSAFASEITMQINELVNSADLKLRHIYLITSAEFVGILRPHLAAMAEKISISEIIKNITRQDTQTIQRYLPKPLWKRRVAGVQLE